LVMVDIAIGSLETRFQELQSFKSKFGFLMSSTTLKSLDNIELILQTHCLLMARQMLI
jgi:hypothetical protein